MDVDFSKVGEAFGAYGEKLTDPAEVPAAIERCLKEVRGGRTAMLHASVTKLIVARRAYSAFTAARATGAHFSTSPRTNCVSSAGVIALVSIASISKCLRISGRSTILITSRLSAPTIVLAAGRPARPACAKWS